MNRKRLQQINRAIGLDRAFLAKLFWEYRQQYLDQCDAMTDPDFGLCLPTSDRRWIDCQTNARDCAYASWFYGNDQLNAG